MTMLKRTTLIGAGALAVLAISTGCSSSNEPEHPAGHSPSASATAAPTPSTVAEDHNDADAMFAMHMIPHHQQAIEMSDMVLAKQGIDPRVTELAKQIKAAQGPEIEQMQGWLNQWGMPMQSGNMPMPSGNMPMPSGSMPGHGDMTTTSEMPSMSGMPGMPSMSGMPGMPGMSSMP